MSKKLLLKEYLNIREDIEEKDVSLDVCDKEEETINKGRIKKLFYAALRGDYIVYFKGVPVDEPYEGYEFKDDEEEFFYYNDQSYIIVRDITDFKVKFKVRYLKNYKFENVYKLVEKAFKYTKKHPELLD